MKYKTLFRVLLKILGVYFAVWGITGFLSGVFWILFDLWVYESLYNWSPRYGFTDSIVRIGIGLYLFFGGKWIVDKAIPGNRPYCFECGYDLTGAADSRCSECGTPFKSEDVAPRTDG